jgi:hypothetical protein
MTISYFEELKTSVKDKWLDYYHTNRHWINKLGGCENDRPYPLFILATIVFLEPRIKEYLILFEQLNSSPDALVKILGLFNLNYPKELEIRLQERTKKSTEEAGEYLNKFREENKT